jgi:hypothetical protein
VHGSQKHRDRPATSLCLAAATISLGVALYINGGFYNTRALLLVTFAYLFCVLGAVLRQVHAADGLARRLTVFVLAAGLAYQLYRLFLDAVSWQPVVITLLGVTALLFVKSEAFELSWVRLILLTALLAPHFIIGLSAIREFGNPNFDVYWCQMHSLDALLKGINPHTLTLGYKPGDEVNYPASYVFGGRVHIGFPYPPLSLFLALPGYLLGGDYRYSNLAATTLSGYFIASARPSRMSFLSAALFLTTPCLLPVLKSGWTEPYVVLMLSATVFCACKAPRWLPWALGLLFASKQYAIFAGLAVFLLPVESDTLKGYAVLTGKALLLAAAITLPLALWNVSGFINDVLNLQFRLPFRMDSLSYLVWLTYNTGVQPPAAVGFLMMVPAVALMAWRGARTPSGFAAAASLIFLSLFAFNKQAFINYYFFVIGAMCCAVAASGASFSPKEGPSPVTGGTTRPGRG